MAELHVQKKDTNIWPWIIGLLVIAAVVWFAFGRSATNDNTDSMSQNSGSVGTASNPGAPRP
jgi:hypothetical protein